MSDRTKGAEARGSSTQRNNASVKDILSRISQDEDAAVAVVAEIRNILVRDLHSSDSSSASTSVEGPKSIQHGLRDRDRRSSSVGGVQHATPRKVDVKEKIQQKAQEDEKEELMFTINKDSDAYRNIFSMVQWYRDSFIVGSEFADQRSVERRGEESKKKNDRESDNAKQTFSLPNSFLNVNPSIYATIIPITKFTGYGYPLLHSYAESYIPSKDAVNLLLPSATWLVSRDGPMLPTATSSLAQTIPLAQSSSDWAMKDNVLWVLKDEEWKAYAKSITTVYVDRSYKDD